MPKVFHSHFLHHWAEISLSTEGSSSRDNINSPPSQSSNFCSDDTIINDVINDVIFSYDSAFTKLLDLHLTSDGLGKMFEGDFEDSCVVKFPLMPMGGHATMSSVRRHWE